jgi:TIR domain-containing protein
MSAKNIFICYRRDDAEGYAGRLYDRLNSRFPRRVFMDVTGISPGADFTTVIRDTVGSCHVLIAIIGRHWTTLKDASNRRRLDLADDYVRHEIATALSRNITVIPVLVRGAEMPSRELLPPDLAPLSTRNALEITDTDFDHDVHRLIEVLENVCGESRPVPMAPSTSTGRSSCLIFAVIGTLAVGAVVIVLFLLGYILSQSNSGETGSTPQPTYTAPSQEPALTQQPGVANQFPVGRWTLRIVAAVGDGREDACEIDIHRDGTYVTTSGHSGYYSYAANTLQLQNWGEISFESQNGDVFAGSGTLNNAEFRIALMPR